MVGAGSVSSVGEDAGEHTGDGVVVGVLIVKLLDEGKSFGLVFADEDGGKLGGEHGVVRGFCQRVAEEGFGFGVLLAGNEQVNEVGGGGSRAGVTGESAPVGSFSDVGLAGIFGDVGAEEGVGLGLGGDFEGFEEFSGG